MATVDADIWCRHRYSHLGEDSAVGGADLRDTEGILIPQQQAPYGAGLPKEMIVRNALLRPRRHFSGLPRGSQLCGYVSVVVWKGCYGYFRVRGTIDIIKTAIEALNHLHRDIKPISLGSPMTFTKLLAPPPQPHPIMYGCVL